MLTLVCAWALLLAVCWPAGAALLERVGAVRSIRRAEDRFVLSVWLGAALLAQMLLAASLFVPLRPLTGAALAGVLVAAASLLSPAPRDELKRALTTKPAAPLGLLVLALGVAAYASQPVTFYDTGLYHFGVIKWLSEHGAVRGLALVHFRFGLASTWLALAAPFNAGPFAGRVGSLTGGFVLLVASLQLLLCVRRCVAGEARTSDWLVVLSCAVAVPPVIYWRMPVSSSPDLPVIFLTTAVVWLMVLTREDGGVGHGSAALRMIALLLACGAAAVKTNALPLLLVTCFFYAWDVGFSFRRLLGAFAVAALSLSPVLAYGVVTSGCPLYPSPVLCLDLPWSVTGGEPALVSTIIREYARWDGATPPWANSWNWVGRWLTPDIGTKSAAALALCLLSAAAGLTIGRVTRARAAGYGLLALGCAGVFLFLLLRAPNFFMVAVTAAGAASLSARGAKALGCGRWPLVCGLAGTALVLYAAPSLRFGLPYTGALFACLVAPFAHHFSEARRATIVNTRRLAATTAALFAAGGLLFFALSFVVKTQGDAAEELKTGWERVLLPPPLPQAPVSPREVNGLKYVVPAVGNQCWAAELPCSVDELAGDFILRDPVRGLAGGFVRRSR